jgi:hypothetical protein
LGKASANGTSASSASDGLEVRPTFLSFQSNTIAAYLNTRTDGTILSLQKNGSAVGSIGAQTRTSNTELGIGTGDTGLNFFNQGDAICPANMDNGFDRNGAIDLGRSGVAFKDLYLTGGVNFGGPVSSGGTVSSSNVLDDYEEGAWTPVLKDGSVGAVINLSASYGYYTKIGRQVTVYGYSNRSDSTAYNSTLLITGLPFTSTNLGGYLSFNGGAWSDRSNTTDPIGIIYSDRNTTTAYIKTLNQSQAYFSSSDVENTRPIYFSFHYLTDS